MPCHLLSRGEWAQFRDAAGRHLQPALMGPVPTARAGLGLLLLRPRSGRMAAPPHCSLRGGRQTSPGLERPLHSCPSLSIHSKTPGAAQCGRCCGQPPQMCGVSIFGGLDKGVMGSSLAIPCPAPKESRAGCPRAKPGQEALLVPSLSSPRPCRAPCPRKCQHSLPHLSLC